MSAGVAASACPAQLPLRRLSISGARGRLGPAICVRAFGGLWDIIAVVLALLALMSLPIASGVVIAWIFNLWGTADLFNAFYQANHAGLMPGQLGATYFIPTFIVPTRRTRLAVTWERLKGRAISWMLNRCVAFEAPS